MIDPRYRAVLLALADDELCMGHRHSEWLGVAPFLEEDLAFASIGQDELGHARALYELLSNDVDALAFGRDQDAFRSCHLVELPCRSWEDALARHYLYDLAETVRWETLLVGEDAVAGVAQRALREERYHTGHAEPMMRRMLEGTEESHRRLTESLEALYPFARALFEPTAAESDVVIAGLVGSGAAELEMTWCDRVRTSLGRSGVALDWEAAPAGLGGRNGSHSEYFASMWETMTAVTAIDPAAAW